MFAVQRHFFFSRQLRVRRTAPLLLLASVTCSPYSDCSSSCVNAALHLCHTVGKVLFYFRFPEAQHNPTIIAQFDGVFKVALHITPDFFVPKLGTITNITHTMPKLTIAKNSYFVFGNDDIRMAAAHLIILAVADALVPQCLAQEDFYFGVLARVSKHSFMSLVRI